MEVPTLQEVRELSIDTLIRFSIASTFLSSKLSGILGAASMILGTACVIAHECLKEQEKKLKEIQEYRRHKKNGTNCRVVREEDDTHLEDWEVPLDRIKGKGDEGELEHQADELDEPTDSPKEVTSLLFHNDDNVGPVAVVISEDEEPKVKVL